MNNFEKELLLWEQLQHERIMARLYPAKSKLICPRTEALRDYRHHRGTGHWYSKETKEIRKCTYRHFRRKQKHALHSHGEILTPVPHDYKTYGWIQW